MRRVAEMTEKQWHVWRSLGIGASDAPTVMGSSPWSTPFELWAQRTGRIKAQKANFAMKRGLDLEPKARTAYEQAHGIAVPKMCGEYEENPVIRASFDGLNLEAKRVVEIKCPGREDHLTARKGKIPEKYLWQCVHLLLVSGLDELHYYSFDGKTGVTVPMGRDTKLEARLIAKETAFWQHVLEDRPPEERKATSVDAHGIFKVRRTR